MLATWFVIVLGLTVLILPFVGILAVVAAWRRGRDRRDYPRPGDDPY
jgi:hypothetical protein